VANVAAETAHGEGGLELRRGVKHFPPGAKVWVLPPQWGDGADQLIIAGHHRGTHGRGYTGMVLARRHLTGFRVQGVYSPAPIRPRASGRPGTKPSRAPRSGGPCHSPPLVTLDKTGPGGTCRHR
jgi:hypothetical protein